MDECETTGINMLRDCSKMPLDKRNVLLYNENLNFMDFDINFY
jgi:hypothetical protein